jgi:hypothetical protein
VPKAGQGEQIQRINGKCPAGYSEDMDDVGKGK